MDINLENKNMNNYNFYLIDWLNDGIGKIVLAGNNSNYLSKHKNKDRFDLRSRQELVDKGFKIISDKIIRSKKK